VTKLNQFISYYVRSALPFLSGIAFGIFLMRWDHPLWLQVLAGLTLVVVGPFVIRLVLTLIVEALRGVPEHDNAPVPRIRPELRHGIDDRRTERGAANLVGSVHARPVLGPYSRDR